MTAKPRPLSPHLGIYKWQISSVLSILHRMTGVALALGLVILVAWLVMVAGGTATYVAFTNYYKFILGAAAVYAVVFVIILFCLCFVISHIVKSSSKIVKWILNLLIFAISGYGAAAGLFAIAYVNNSETPVQIANWIGMVVMFGVTGSFFYHFCNGIRHLFWDAGKFLSIRGMNIGGWIVIALSVIMTFGIWAKILGIITW